MTQEVIKNSVSLSFAAGCLLLYFFFPVGEYKFEIFVGATSFLLILPVLYNKLILHRKIEDVGFSSLRIDMSTAVYIGSAVVIGGLLSFFILTLQWGVQKYLLHISPAILQNFGAFIIYEFIFISSAIFLITFFAWGFVYSIKWRDQIVSYITALVVFALLLVDFFESFWVALPFLVPAFFVQKIRDRNNIVYLALAVFMIGLILDTLIVKSLSY